MDPEDHMEGGEFIAPDVSPRARVAILAARAFMYSDQMAEPLERAILDSGDYTSDGAVPFLSQIVASIAENMGINDPIDLHALAVHMAGSFADLVEKMGDPGAADKPALVEDIVEGIMAILGGEVGGMEPMGDPGMDPMAGPGMAMQGQPDPLLESGRGF